MRTVTEEPPLDSFALSLGLSFAALAGSAAVVASADSLGRGVELVVVFVVLTTLECLAYVETVRPLLAGKVVSPRGVLAQVVVVLLALLAFLGGVDMGIVGLCALPAGVFLPHALSIRYRRVQQELAEEVRPRTSDVGEDEAPSPDHPVRARPAPKVGRVLQAAADEERDRWMAWMMATLAVTVGCIAVGTPVSVVLGVDLLGVVAVGWATRRLLAARVALREFEEALEEPSQAFVVVIRPPGLPGEGPLLGMWRKEPVLADGRLPRADAVYRCDATRDALFSGPGALVVHRAWVDTGPRPGSRPRWVAADAGVALPRHRALLGSQSLESSLDTERPARSRPLTMPAPNPTKEAETGTFVTVVNEPEGSGNHVAWMFARRLAILAGTAVVLAWWLQG